MGTVGAPAELHDDSAVDQAVEKRFFVPVMTLLGMEQ